MPTISVYLDDMDIELVDRMVRMGLFPNRSQAVRMALMKYATDLKVLGLARTREKGQPPDRPQEKGEHPSRK